MTDWTVGERCRIVERDDPTIADRLGITVAQVRGLRKEFDIPPGETRWSHGHQRPRESAEDAATAAGEGTYG
jgi:hypothetical protein